MYSFWQFNNYNYIFKFVVKGHIKHMNMKIESNASNDTTYSMDLSRLSDYLPQAPNIAEE